MMSNKRLWIETHNSVYDEVLCALQDCDTEFAAKDMEAVADKLAIIKAEESFADSVDEAMTMREK